ncbi:MULTISPECIES: hypothetical protein [unclassified Acinetobacter]|uniref:hypothetical protein n=1 Tax=unclassified Acinetobacter TaxID=196816 RepID=UPI002577A64D|nr:MULTISPECIES: hypothetical protein [unclassified Acinetobacter]MDM1765644.1 hypothetical protein [Acinetobacter sp. 226-1]MDM1769236.1 hypothetical protein [Acinetobacter sp. 226-4]
MYFWNTKALAHELSEDTLEKRHYKNYYLIAALVVSVAYYYGMLSPYYDVRVIGVEAVLTLMIMFIGIQRTYVANGGDNGVHFMNRVTALSFPILLQTTVAGIVFGLVLLGIYQFFQLENTTFDLWYEWCVSAFTIFLQILFFTRLNKYMKRVAEHTI